MPAYPEHEKLKALDGRNQTVGSFLEWLEARGVVLCERTANQIHNLYAPARRASFEQLIAEFFEIDRDKLEAEKRAMIEELRAKRAP